MNKIYYYNFKKQDGSKLIMYAYPFPSVTSLFLPFLYDSSQTNAYRGCQAYNNGGGTSETYITYAHLPHSLTLKTYKVLHFLIPFHSPSLPASLPTSPLQCLPSFHTTILPALQTSPCLPISLPSSLPHLYSASLRPSLPYKPHLYSAYLYLPA